MPRRFRHRVLCIIGKPEPEQQPGAQPGTGFLQGGAHLPDCLFPQINLFRGLLIGVGHKRTPAYRPSKRFWAAARASSMALRMAGAA